LSVIPHIYAETGFTACGVCAIIPLTRLFTAEYAGLFDVFLPGLAAWRMPLPLGGTSNHFHTPTLRQLGGWDPYNVTEDADLGIRLARGGFHTTLVQSSTYEEAPARLMPWIRQRTRWFKGYLRPVNFKPKYLIYCSI
jgi:cellulose synthase/poly-beta-1,6-N-acetylglucosamine synthase-like glycosyltransferase